jgi:hypothetical protein
MHIHVPQRHRLSGIDVQFRVAPQRLGSAFVILVTDRRQGLEQPRCESSALLFGEAQRLSRDLLNTQSNARLMLCPCPVNWRVRSGSQLQEVLQDYPSVLGQDAFRMELHAPNRELLMPHAHDFTLFGLRR